MEGSQDYQQQHSSSSSPPSITEQQQLSSSSSSPSPLTVLSSPPDINNINNNDININDNINNNNNNNNNINVNSTKKIAGWLHNNILDYVSMKDIKNDVSKKGIELNGPKAPYEGDHNVMETISNGIQLHLKQLIELSMTTARRRNDFSTYVVFDQLKRILKDNGDHPSSALKDGFTLAWDEDYNTDLQYQEEIAKQKLEKKFLEDEDTMKREMLNIERSKLSIYKRNTMVVKREIM